MNPAVLYSPGPALSDAGLFLGVAKLRCLKLCDRIDRGIGDMAHARYVGIMLWCDPGYLIKVVMDTAIGRRQGYDTGNLYQGQPGHGRTEPGGMCHHHHAAAGG